MINVLKKIFGRENNSPFYSKLSKAIRNSSYKLGNIEYAFYLGGFKFEEPTYKEFIRTLNENDFNVQICDINYDTQKDNVEVYYIIDSSKQGFLVTMLDPLELYQAETILDVFSVGEKRLIFNNKKLIFPAVATD